MKKIIKIGLILFCITACGFQTWRERLDSKKIELTEAGKKVREIPIEYTKNCLFKEPIEVKAYEERYVGSVNSANSLRNKAAEKGGNAISYIDVKRRYGTFSNYSYLFIANVYSCEQF
jgi:hypothetical protein